jgi:two-component system, OmpR family, osmolarity sensor histidine kinase EnvZ
MSSGWLHRSLPRSLYGRAALILLLPVVTVQIVVMVAFIQRHYDGVTRQMAAAMALQLNHVAAEIGQAADPGAEAARLAAALAIEVSYPAGPVSPGQGARLTDFSAGALREALMADVRNLLAVSIDGTRRVIVWIGTPGGSVEIAFDRRRVSASNPHQLIVITLVLGALMTLIAYVFLRNQLRPIKRLAAAAEAYGRGRTTAYSPGGATEVRAAGTAFLDMRARIERQAQARTHLLTGVSHDLRTPLTRLRLGLSMIDEAEAAPLIRDVDEMQAMVTSFLDFAREDQAEETAPTDVPALLARIVADAGRAGQAVGLQPVEGVPAPVPLRPGAIRRAVENLIGNALRHGTRAEVSATFMDRSLRLTVEDDGPGIPPDQRDEALRPFVRLDPARNQDRGEGVGLGLSIVADIARAHGGVLRLDKSERLGGLRADLVIAR